MTYKELENCLGKCYYGKFADIYIFYKFSDEIHHIKYNDRYYTNAEYYMISKNKILIDSKIKIMDCRQMEEIPLKRYNEIKSCLSKPIDNLISSLDVARKYKIL